MSTANIMAPYTWQGALQPAALVVNTLSGLLALIDLNFVHFSPLKAPGARRRLSCCHRSALFLYAQSDKTSVWRIRHSLGSRWDSAAPCSSGSLMLAASAGLVAGQ
jgi:hypothetical protein